MESTTTETIPTLAPPGGENAAPSSPPPQRERGELEKFALLLQQWAQQHGKARP